MSLSEVLDSTENINKIQGRGSFIDSDEGNSSFQGAPEWLTRNYMESHLKLYYKDKNLRITEMQASPALSKGENYSGILTRITTNYQTVNNVRHTGHYIIKTSFEGNEFAQKKMEPYDIFNREMNIYENILPKLNDLMLEINDRQQIFAETIAVDYQRSALIFEDLNVRNFVMPDRIKGLDMKTCKLVLRKLAKIHATSAVLNERESGCLEGFDRGMFNRHTDNYAPCFVGLLEACSNLLCSWKDYEYYGKKLAVLKPMYMELAKRVFDVTNGHLNVLVHGDLWTNNIMVKYDEKNGEPVDVIIIDFQYSAWGSPAIDLFYFLNTSPQEDILLNQQDELLQYYYINLANTLQKLHFKGRVPSLHNFHLQIEEKAFYGMFIYAFNSCCIIQPVQRVEETDDADFNALMMEDERAKNFKNTVYKNTYMQRIIKLTLPIYDRKGLLEIDQ